MDEGLYGGFILGPEASDPRLYWLLTLLGSALLIGASLGGFVPGRSAAASRTTSSWNAGGLMLAALSVGAAVWLYGVVGGIIIVVAVLWHEWGHTIAFRNAGHDDARFRLLPFMGGVAISNRLPENQAAECYITLMGPGFSLLLLVAFATAAWQLEPIEPLYASYAWLGMMIVGALNTLNMLPLWPLDGGRALRSIARTIGPGAARILTLAMSALFVAGAIALQLWILLIFAVLGFLSAEQHAALDEHQPPMSIGQTGLATLGYAAILLCHLVACLPLVLQFLPV